MLVRKYIRGEEPLLWNIFFNTIHSVNIRDYSLEQINAWAPVNLSSEVWCTKIESINPFVAVVDGQIVGYADLQSSGYIDHFFCHCKFQGIGVGKTLMCRILEEAKSKSINELYSDVSITAKPFYEKMGFVVKKEQKIQVRGEELTNYQMFRAKCAR